VNQTMNKTSTEFADGLTATTRRLGKLAACATSSSRRNDLTPKLTLIDCAPEDLSVPIRNVRKLSVEHVRAVTNAISHLGFCDPILIDERNTVLDGAVRLEAAKILGLPRIPCIRADHLTDAERRLLRLAINRLSEKGAWDLDELKVELKEIVLQDVDLKITGFSMPQIERIIIGDERAPMENVPLVPQPNAKIIVQVGDIFALGKHRLICGNPTEAATVELLMSGTDDAKLIMTEPYKLPVAGAKSHGRHTPGLEMSEAFSAAWIRACQFYLRDGGLFAPFIDWRDYPGLIAAAGQFDLIPFDLVVWVNKESAEPNLYRSQHKLLPLLADRNVGGLKLNKKRGARSNVWSYPAAHGSLSDEDVQFRPSAVKPAAMLKGALLDFTQCGDVVIDPFLGSGATLMACEQNGRHCRGIELNPLYVDVVLRQYEAMTQRPAILESTGETYAEFAARRQHHGAAL
jgi:DNA methylase/ParB-like nuclease family protein